MRRLLFTIVAVVAALSMPSAVVALHEDQAGLYDWHRPGVGPVVLAALQPYSKRMKTVNVASSKNVIASFGIQKGQLRWRHVLGEEDTVTCLVATDHVVYAGTASGQMIGFDPARGRVLRAYPFPQGRVTGCAAGVESVHAVVASAADSTVSVASLPLLPSDMTMELPPSKVKPVARLPAEVTADSIKAATLLENGAVVLFSLVKDGGILGVDLRTETTLRPSGASTPSAGAFRFVQACGATAITDTGLIVSVNPAAKGELTIKAQSVREGLLGCTAASVPSVVSPTVSPTGFLTWNDDATGLRVRPGDRVLGLDARFEPAHNRVELVVASASGALLYIRGRINTSIKNEPTDAVVMSSWFHDGGLGDVVRVVFPQARADLANEDAAVSGTAEARTVKFGLNDRLVLASGTGMLYSLRSGDGGNATEWAAYAAADATIEHPSTQGAPFEVVSLREVVGSAVIVVELRFANAAETVADLSYDIYTGRLLSAVSSEDRNQHVAAVLPSHTGGAVVFADLTVSEASPRDRHFHLVDKKKGQVTGYAIPAGTTKAVLDWRVDLGSPIAAIASGAADPRLVSSVESLRFIPNATSGAKDIRRKYPTANVIATAHFMRDPDEPDVTSLVITAIDTVTGQLIATLRHFEAAGRVPIVIAEHAIVYHYLDVGRMQYMVGVWELFEKEDKSMEDSQTTSPALVVMSLFDRRRTFTSTKMRPARVEPLLFAFAHGDVASIGVTVSQQGIARKLVVFALAEGSVITVPLSILLAGGIPDTPAGQKGPSKTTVMAPSTMFVTHRHRVSRPEHVFTAPTPLESTSHVLVAGVDLFYVRASSGKPFDMIDEEFNRPSLVIGCVILPIAVLVFKYLAQRRALSVAWM